LTQFSVENKKLDKFQIKEDFYCMPKGKKKQKQCEFEGQKLQKPESQKLGNHQIGASKTSKVEPICIEKIKT
jgi:hypothetical protein